MVFSIWCHKGILNKQCLFFYEHSKIEERCTYWIDDPSLNQKKYKDRHSNFLFAEILLLLLFLYLTLTKKKKVKNRVKIIKFTRYKTT